MASTTDVVRAEVGVTKREEFGVSQVEERAETASVAVAAREQAAINARYIVAERHPRDVELFRTRLLKECKRPDFAAKAEYSKPVGKAFENGRWVEKKARGPSIRFIEAALRCFGNVYPEVTTVYDSAELRICRVSVTDLESNLTYTSEIPIQKAVERRGGGKEGQDPPKGRIVISQRLNSDGDPTFLVWATDDEVLVKQNALLSKAIRTNAQRLLPYDIVEECLTQCRKIIADADAKDPDTARRRLIDAFSELSVEPADLHMLLGHPVDKVTPAELNKLREVYVALKDGEATWQEIMEAVKPGGSAEAAEKVAEQKIAGFRRNTKKSEEAGGSSSGSVATATEREQTDTRQGSGTPVKSPPPAPAGQPADAPLTEEQNRELDRKLAEEENREDRKAERDAADHATDNPPQRGFGFRGRRQ